MHFRDLHITHKAFWKIERKAKYYDKYMKERKNWKKWIESVPLDEVRKLFKFIRLWDFHFRGNVKKFIEIYNETFPIIKELEHERLENVNFNNTELQQKIVKIFDKMAQCSEEAYESTDCSKILHTILPHLFVMWDQSIREGILGDEKKKSGANYALEFLPRMQVELQEAINSCMKERELNREDAIQYIRQACGYETLPKLIDEHNYVIYTKSLEFRTYLEKLREKGQIMIEEYKGLKNKLPL